jgi:hypothetical protein
MVEKIKANSISCHTQFWKIYGYTWTPIQRSLVRSNWYTNYKYENSQTHWRLTSSEYMSVAMVQLIAHRHQQKCVTCQDDCRIFNGRQLKDAWSSHGHPPSWSRVAEINEDTFFSNMYDVFQKKCMSTGNWCLSMLCQLTLVDDNGWQSCI